MHRFLCGIATVLSLSGVGSASGGYLSAVGPAPLRFVAAAAPAGKSTLPPLPADKPVPAVPMPASVATAAVVPVEQPLRPFSTPVLVAATDATSVTPQMYVEVFTRDAGGTGGDRAVLLPLNFVPPTLTNPASTRASRATYTQE